MMIHYGNQDGDDDDQDLNGPDADKDDDDTVAVPGWSRTSWESLRENRRWISSSPTWVKHWVSVNTYQNID